MVRTSSVRREEPVVREDDERALDEEGFFLAPDEDALAREEVARFALGEDAFLAPVEDALARDEEAFARAGAFARADGLARADDERAERDLADPPCELDLGCGMALSSRVLGTLRSTVRG